MVIICDWMERDMIIWEMFSFTVFGGVAQFFYEGRDMIL